MSSTHSPIVIGGTIAIDHVKTPESEGTNLLGGSAAYAALAASFFSKPVSLIGIIGHDFPQEHLDMLETRGVSLEGVERSENESFTWSGEYHANMNERTTHRVGLNVLESWQVKVPETSAASTIVVLANMSPDNQIEMLTQCGIASGASSDGRFVIADTMDLWISIANERLHSRSKLTPWNARPVKGVPVHTVVRGRFVMRDLELVADTRGWGRSVKSVQAMPTPKPRNVDKTMGAIIATGGPHA